MKRYGEKSRRWETLKALEFFLNFIRNHKSEVKDNDTFAIVANLESHQLLIKRIKDTFPKAKLDGFQKSDYRRNRLDFDDDPQEILRTLWYHQSIRPALRRMFAAMAEDYRAKYKVEDCSKEIFPQKVAELQETFGLSDFETDILLVFNFVSADLLEMSDGHHRRTGEADKITFVAKSLDCDREAVMNAVSDTGKLRRFYCIDRDLDFNSRLSGFLNGINSEVLTSRFFSRSQEETLPWNFYGELAQKHGSIIKDIITAAKGQNGVNILLYGAPGTGKTSFARTLAAEMGRNCYFIAQDSGDVDGSASSPEHRFAALQVCNSQLDPAASLIVVDEADEMLRGYSTGGLFAMFGGSSSSVGDKGLLNSVLDTVKTPAIWITNTPAETLDKSSRRRFDYSIKFEPLSTAQRLAIWKNNAAKLKLDKLFDDDMLKSFAERYPVSAGGISLVLKNIARLAPAREETAAMVDKLMAPHCELMGIPAVPPGAGPAQDYSLEGLNIKGGIQLDRIVNAVRNFRSGTLSGIDSPRMNLLLHGMPGTGKTEFVKYLGQVLNTKVVVRMGSDLLSMYVGGTEQNIKAAFAQAEAEKAILFLDEIDGLVQSRERAQRSWEVTQVNELLHQMENFNGIMAGATNFLANLDAAVLRRFTFKLEFDYLDDGGKKIFFERMFRTCLTAAEEDRLNNIPRLAPVDFRTVRQSLFYLGGDVTNSDRLSALEQESSAKNQDKIPVKMKVGF